MWIVKAIAKLIFLAFMLYISIFISRVVCCSAFSAAKVGMFSPEMQDAFFGCFTDDGVPPAVSFS